MCCDADSKRPDKKETRLHTITINAKRKITTNDNRINV